MIDRRSFLRVGAGAGVVAAVGLPSVAAGGASALGSPNWSALRRALSGVLVLPSDVDYQRAKQLHLGQFDVYRPGAVAYCATVGDVRTGIRFAQDNQLRAIPRSGGHSFAGYSSADNALIIDVSRLNSLRVDSSTVTFGPGAQQVDALAALSPRGLALVSGLCPTVCPGGFMQGGGIGWQTRKFGMAVDRIVSAQVVLADGRIVRVAADREPELFWALRGGGGGFGVVTEYEVRPTPVTTLVNYNLVWQWDAALAVIEAWQRWIIDGPRDLGSTMAVQLVDAKPGAVPDVVLAGGWLGTKAELDRQLDELIAEVGYAPTVRTVEAFPYYDGMMQWYGCSDKTVQQCHRVGYTPEAALPRDNFVVDRNRMCDDAVSTSGINAALAAFDADRLASQFRYLSFFALGGAANRPARRETAYVHRTSEFYFGYTAALSNPNPSREQRTATESWVDKGFAVLDRNSNGEAYQNFIDPRLTDWRESYYAENYPRLVAAKRRYDPYRFFHNPQSVG